MLFDPGRRIGLAALAVGLLAGCGGGGRDHGSVYVTPLNSKQAPLVTVRQLLQADSLIGRRVRVVGTCALAGSGPSTGAWVLQEGGFSIEVRGLVPASCFTQSGDGQQLAIFAQVEPKSAGSRERLLLRLPE
jgi:hypothetical protein